MDGDDIKFAEDWAERHGIELEMQNTGEGFFEFYYWWEGPMPDKMARAFYSDNFEYTWDGHFKRLAEVIRAMEPTMPLPPG